MPSMTDVSYLCHPNFNSGMNQYEIVIIFTPVLPDSDLQKVIKKYADLIKKGSGEIVSEETWGLKSLAYPIHKKTTGIYHLFEYTAEGDFNEEIETLMKRDENVMRWLITRLDKYAVQYGQRRRDRLAKEAKEEQQASAKAEEEVAPIAEENAVATEEKLTAKEDTKEAN